MKKFPSFIAVICFTGFLSSEAQITKGKVMLGISSGINFPGEVSSVTDPFSFNFITMQTTSNVFYREPVKSTSINLQPFAGYCNYDNLILGLKFSYRYNFRERDLSNPWDPYDGKMTIFMGGPFIRFYFWNFKTKSLFTIPCV